MYGLRLIHRYSYEVSRSDRKEELHAARANDDGVHLSRGILPVPDARLAAEWYAGEFEFQIARRGSKEIDLMLGEGEISITMIRMEERIHR